MGRKLHLWGGEDAWEGLIPKRRWAQRGVRQPTELEYEVVQRIGRNKALKVVFSDEKMAERTRYRLRVILHHNEISEAVCLSVRGNVLYAWLLATFPTKRINQEIEHWAAHHLIDGTGGQYKPTLRDEQRDIEILSKIDLNPYRKREPAYVPQVNPQYQRRVYNYDGTITPTEGNKVESSSPTGLKKITGPDTDEPEYQMMLSKYDAKEITTQQFADWMVSMGLDPSTAGFEEPFTISDVHSMDTPKPNPPVGDGVR